MSTPSGFIDAVWVGPFNGEAVLHDGTIVQVVSGETVCAIPAGEAEASANWQPVTKQASKAAKPQET